MGPVSFGSSDSKTAPGINMEIKIWQNEWGEYELLDSGDGERMERFGSQTLIREEPKAWWRRTLSKDVWEKNRSSVGNSTSWAVRYNSVSVILKTTGNFKHVGIFPEQSPEWRWAEEKIRAAKGRKIRVLNLFGYTGIISLVAASAGASVTHVDASKVALEWARENQKASGLEKADIRWILDDALKFVKREARRGNKYDAIILDPPTFGRGPQKQVWKIEEGLEGLLESSAALLSESPLFVFLTTYRMGESSIVLGNLLGDAIGNRSGKIETGEFVLVGSAKNGHPLPMSTFACWEG